MVPVKPSDKVKAMNLTYYEKGSLDGKRELLRDLLEERYGSLSAEVIDRLTHLPPERLKSLGRAVLRAASLKELGLVDE